MSDSTRYPFRLADALAGQPVITRMNESIVGLIDTDEGVYPLEQEGSTAIFLCWTLDGTEFYGKESFNDLFMLHPPEPKADETSAL